MEGLGLYDTGCDSAKSEAPSVGHVDGAAEEADQFLVFLENAEV